MLELLPGLGEAVEVLADGGRVLVALLYEAVPLRAHLRDLRLVPVNLRLMCTHHRVQCFQQLDGIHPQKSALLFFKMLSKKVFQKNKPIFLRICILRFTKLHCCVPVLKDSTNFTKFFDTCIIQKTQNFTLISNLLYSEKVTLKYQKLLPNNKRSGKTPTFLYVTSMVNNF